MINIKIKLKASKVKAYLQKLMRRSRNARFRSLQNTALKQVNTILERTDKGQGSMGRFKPYTNEYEKFKRSIGQGSKPNLQVSNFMLSNMKVKGDSNKAQIFFSNQKANELAFHNDKTRPFFSVTDKEEKDLIKNFEQQLFKHLGL